uniref:Uncharacterized protein n=1 Tax=Caenorhabditis japonica TaxID=281687 RepID=A0A8R1EIT0_CAEJA
MARRKGRIESTSPSAKHLSRFFSCFDLCYGADN